VHADRRARVGRLHEQGEAQGRGPGRDLARAAAPPFGGDGLEGHHGDAAVAEEALGDVLVHPHRRAEHARADIGDVGELEETLHGAVLAVGAVQDREDHVVRAQGRERLIRLGVGLHRGQRSLAVEGELARITSGARQGATIFAMPASLLVDADQNRLEAGRVEGRQDVARREQRHFVLGGAATEEDHHPGPGT